MPLDRSIGNYYDSSGSFVRRVAHWTGPQSYTPGGETANAGTFGVGKIVALFLAPMTDGTSFRVPVYHQAAGKILIFDPASGSEIASATDLSTFTTSIEVIGA